MKEFTIYALGILTGEVIAYIIYCIAISNCV